MARPTIGITTTIDEQGYFRVRPEYPRAVEKAGGVPLLFAPGRPDEVGTLLDRVDGLLLSGGSDIDPAIYGETPHPTTQWVRERDDFELGLTREALARDMAILAICRGHQVLNVALGGTLVQDIPSQRPGAAAHAPKDIARWDVAHEVEILPDTRLRAIVGRDVLGVNSTHHQAVGALGNGLRLTARSRDGIVEGIESAPHRFAIGVQWHPEAMWNREPDHQELFRALIESARRC
jgi:putative glutamine amidotransferase